MPKSTCPKCNKEALEESICCDRCNKWYHFNCSELSKSQIRSHCINKYKKWKCVNCIENYCSNCTKTFNNEYNYSSICCDKCNNWYHNYCTTLSNTDFETFCSNINAYWKCDQCNDKYCHKCDINLYRKLNVVCNICNHKFDNKCAGITKEKYKCLNEKEETWTCRECYSSLFPFHTIDNSKLDNLFDRSNKKHSLNNIVTNEHTKICTICNKKVLQPKSSLPCCSCNSLIHKKCSNLKKEDLNKFHQFKGKWECITCKHDKFPFSFIDNSHLNDMT